MLYWKRNNKFHRMHEWNILNWMVQRLLRTFGKYYRFILIIIIRVESKLFIYMFSVKIQKKQEDIKRKQQIRINLLFILHGNSNNYVQLVVGFPFTTKAFSIQVMKRCFILPQEVNKCGIFIICFAIAILFRDYWIWIQWNGCWILDTGC